MATVASSLGPAPDAAWATDGYVVVPGAVDRATCAALVAGAGSTAAEHGDPVVARLGADLVAPLAGASVVAAGGRLVVTMPGVAGRPWERQGEDSVALHLALSPATLAGGCPWVVPGSHRHAPAGRGATPPVAGAVPVQLDVGDLVLVDGGVVHRVTDNHSVDAAAALMVVFRRVRG
jgi:hypothetical protein